MTSTKKSRLTRSPPIHVRHNRLTLYPLVDVHNSSTWNCTRNLKISKALLKSQARQGTSLFKSAATNLRGFQRVFKRSSGLIYRIPGGDRVAVKVGVVQMGRVNDQMGRGRSIWRDGISILCGRPRGWRIEEPDEDDVLWLAMTVIEVKKWCGVQVVGHSKDVVQWWISNSHHHSLAPGLWVAL